MSSAVRSSRQDHILSALRNVFAHITGIHAEELSDDVSLLELGVDSLAMVQAAQAIQESLGVKVPFRLMVEENPTISFLADYADKQMPTASLVAEAEHNYSPTAAVAILPQPLMQGGAPQPASPPDRGEPSPAADTAAFSNQTFGNQKGKIMANAPLEWILAQQIEILSGQIELLREAYADGKPLAPAEAVQAASVAPAPALAAAPAAAVSPAHRPEDSPAAAAAVAPAQPATPPSKPESYVPYQAIRTGPTAGLTSVQQRHIDGLIERLATRTARSKQLAQTNRLAHADSRTSAGFRLLWKEMFYPLVGGRSSGARVWDVDGNEYIDIAMGFGALLFGHSPEFITEALKEEMARGIHLGLISEFGGKVAELVGDLTGMERATFCNSGTEAVMIALRLARTVTGRSKIALFSGSYHGFSDEALVRASRGPDQQWHMAPIAPGIPASVGENVLVVEYGADESLDLLRAHAADLAAILVEPVQSRRPDLQPVEFLRELRKLATESGAALIFDEVITGFRVHPGGVQSLFGIEADLATYGKAPGGGMPVGIVAGKAAYLDAIDGGQWSYGNPSYPRAQRTYVAGTYFTHPIIMAAVHAALTHLKQSGPQLQQQLNERTRQMAETLNDYFERDEVPIRLVHFASLFRFDFSEEVKHADLFFYHLLEKGIYTWEGRNCFLSTAHTDEDVEQIIRAVKASAAEMRAGGLIPPRSDRLQVAATAGQLNEPVSQATIDPSASARTIPLTAAQKELWVLTQMGDEASRAYNESMTLHLRGPLDEQAMRRAMQRLVDRHEALRTTFNAGGEEQTIHPRLAIDVPLVDCSTFEPSQREAQAAWWASDEAHQPFDLINGPLLRASGIL